MIHYILYNTGGEIDADITPTHIAVGEAVHNWDKAFPKGLSESDATGIWIRDSLNVKPECY